MRIPVVGLILVLGVLSGCVWAAEPTGLCAISGENYLIGGFENGVWLDASATAKLLRGQETFRKCSLSGSAKETYVGTKPSLEQGPCEYWFVELAPKPAKKDDVPGIQWADGLYLHCPWNPVPRVPTVQTSPDPKYAKVIEDVLTKAGLKKPKIVFEQILRVDLEGDGVEEVIITASNIPDTDLPVTARKGDYSLVLLRKLIGGKVENIVVDLDCQAKDQPDDGGSSVANKFHVPALVDVDGDGVLEIVSEGVYYEGEWIEIFKMKGEKLEKVLNEGVGA